MRNWFSGENNKFQVKYSDPKVCKSFLLACCPHEILSSTVSVYIVWDVWPRGSNPIWDSPDIQSGYFQQWFIEFFSIFIYPFHDNSFIMCKFTCSYLNLYKELIFMGNVVVHYVPLLTVNRLQLHFITNISFSTENNDKIIFLFYDNEQFLSQLLINCLKLQKKRI